MERLIKAETKAQKTLIILMGALLMGLLWRVRGSGGWGSSWGLLNTGILYTLFIITVKGERKKLNLTMLSLTAFSFMLTVPAWGTLLEQICGVIPIGEAQADFYEISVTSAVFLMLCLGFGLATVYGIMLGRGYSDVKWKWYHFVILAGVFLAVKYISMASASHWIVKLIQPQTVEFYSESLKNNGFDGSVYKVYMEHFNNAAWAKKIDGGRNYFAEVKTISLALASVFSVLATKFIIKDKVAARTGLVVSCAFAFSITVSDLLFFFEKGGYHMTGTSIFPESFAIWELWEYLTGFIAGTIITAFLINLKEKEDVTEHLCSQLPDKVRSISYIIMGYIPIVAFSVIRPVFDRMEKTKLLIPSIILATLISALVIVLLIKKFGYKVDKTDVYGFSNKMLMFLLLTVAVIYLFIGEQEKQNFRYIFDGSISHLLFCISFIAVESYIAVNVIKKCKSDK